MKTIQNNPPMLSKIFILSATELSAIRGGAPEYDPKEKYGKEEDEESYSMKMKIHTQQAPAPIGPYTQG